MIRCPSQDWDKYAREQEVPEVCPVCGKDNMDVMGNWLCANYPVFCSPKCGLEYAEEQRKYNEGLAEAYDV